MNVIPWLADLQELPGAEMFFLILMVMIGAATIGFVVDVIMKDLGLGPAANGVLALSGACLGIYLRYRLLSPFRVDDVSMTIGCAIGAAFLLLLGLAVAKSKVL
jgi:uncharacterized membrane protein YeaQ/YmgE (transglycosylase-associated protein family)